jgi:uncharacterized OB-fold protein
MSFYLPEAMTGLKPDASSELYAPFWDAATRGELVVQQCTGCGAFQWLPEWICHSCHSFELSFVPVEPSGSVYSWTRIWHPHEAQLKDYVPYLVVAVQLTSCPAIRMVGNLVGEPTQRIEFGQGVGAVFEHHDMYTLVNWSASQIP